MGSVQSIFSVMPGVSYPPSSTEFTVFAFLLVHLGIGKLDDVPDGLLVMGRHVVGIAAA